MMFANWSGQALFDFYELRK